MKDYALTIEKGDLALPFFAEYPLFVWGVDKPFFDSDGDCKKPADREWHYLDFRNRLSRIDLAIRHQRDGTQQRVLEEAEKNGGSERYWQLIKEIGPPTSRIYTLSSADLPTVQKAAYLTAWRSNGFILQDEQRVTPEAFARALDGLLEHAMKADEVQAEFLASGDSWTW